MEEESTEQYTFEREEKQTLEKLRQVEVNVSYNLKSTNSQLLQTRYYAEFTVNSKQGPITLKNVFITTEQNKDGKISYHFRWFNEDSTLIEEKILVEEDGKVYTIPELEDIFGDTEMDFEELVNENDKEKGKLKGISERATSEQVKKILAKNNQKDDEREEPEEDSEAKTQKIEEDLSEQQGEDVRIGKHREIKDDKIADRIPEAFEKGKQYEVAQKEPTGQYIILEKENGKYKINDKIQQGQLTVKRVFLIDPEGNQRESEIPDQLMSIPGEPRKEISASENSWGEPGIQTVNVTPCQSRIGRAVEMENEGPKGQERKEITDTFERKGEQQLSHEIGHKKEELERTYKVTEIHLEELIELDIESVMEAEAQKAKISKESFKEYVKNAQGKTLQDKINNAHEEIEQEYRGNNTRRR